MKRLFLVLLLAPFLTAAGWAADTVLIHPGEVVYVRFTQKGTKLKLVKASKETDDQAQIILATDKPDPSKQAPMVLKVTNKFTLDIHYKLELGTVGHLRSAPRVFRVVAEKISLEELPPMAQELVLFGFELEK